MTTESPSERPAADWKKVHAFGWPSGSVRALMAVLIFGTVWGQLVLRPTSEVPSYLSDLLFIIMGHYFASRRRADGEPEPGPPPLYLPRGTIRVVLVLGSAAVAFWLYRKGQLTTIERHPGALTLLLVAGFLLGVVFNAVVSWWRSRPNHRPRRLVEDLRAVVSMLAVVLLVALVWNRLLPFVPPERIDTLFGRPLHLGPFGPENLLAAIVGFYFGSRS